MRIRFRYFLILIAFISLSLFFYARAQEPEKIEECRTRQECEELLKEYESKLAEIEKDISGTKEKSKTLKNKIAVLKKEIEKLSLQIRQSNAIVKELGIEIADTEKSIDKTILEIENSKKNLASILRTIYKEDQKSYLEILVAGDKLSDFFNYLTQLESLNSKNQEILGNIETSKNLLENQKTLLAEDKDDLERMVKIQILQKKENEDTKKENDEFLKLTETQYQKSLKEKELAEKKAAEIRARIFELIGVPKAPTFGEALDIAKYVQTLTGVRPAFLLAVLTQESNIGKNVGQCYLKNLETGAGVTAYNGKTVSKVMKPSRDIQPFLEITRELGRDPYNTPVSCPIPSVGGYGGAMGPAQFIPSTWMIYRDRVTAIIGKPADPWDIKDAFLAAALYLADYGAKNQTYNGEWQAAMIYFSGTTNTKYRFYGDSVMKIASSYAEDIKKLEGLAFLPSGRDISLLTLNIRFSQSLYNRF